MSAFMWRPFVVMALAMLTAFAPASANAAFGDLDASFGIGGKQREVKGGIAGQSQIRAQLDGRILFAGASDLFHLDAISRRLSDGSPDTKFGTGGFLRPPDKHVVADFELLADHRIAVLYSAPNRDGVLGMYHPSGDLQWMIDFAQTPKFQPASLAVQGSALLVSGSLPPWAVGIVRVTDSGALDHAFGKSGRVTIDGVVGGGPGYSAIEVGPDMSILLGLDRLTTDGGGQRIARFDANGTLDPSFAIVGLLGWLNQHAAVGVRDLAVSPSGSLVAVLRFGLSGKRGSFSMWDQVVHVTSAGAPIALAPGSSFAASSFAFTAGLTDVAAMPGSGFAIAQRKQVSVLTEDRRLDSRFGLNGRSSIAVGSLNAWTSIDIAPDGKLVVGGAYNGRSGKSTINDRSTIARLLGISGGVAAPQSGLATVFDPVYWLGKRRAPKLLKIQGVAKPVGDLRGVGIAIRRVDKPLLRRGGCRWVTRGGRSTRVVRKRSTGCKRPVFMPALLEANGEWTFRFKRRLTAGSYEVHVRATKSDGTFNALNHDSDAFATFKVKKYRRR